MIDLKYIVTGTGRCGTVYMAKLLTSLGIPCGHETIFDYDGIDAAKTRILEPVSLSISHLSSIEYIPEKDQFVSSESWLENINDIVADSSYMAAPFLSEFNAKIIHVIRNPIRVINSFTNHLDYFEKKEPTNKWEKFIYDILPELKCEMTQYERASLFYVLWNDLIEEKSQIRMKIEEKPNELLSFLKKDNSVNYSKNKVNSIVKKEKDKFTIDQIKSKEIKKRLSIKGKKYQYQIESDYLIL